VQQRALVRVVVVGGVDQDAVGQGREGRLRREAGGADHARARRGRVEPGDAAGEPRLLRVFGPGRDGAADRVEDQAARLRHHRLRQVLIAQPGDEIGQCLRGHAFPPR
jgi:hypothetical protein